MKSIKPGRGPSMMGGFGALASVAFGVIWTLAAIYMGAPVFFPLFGLVFIALGVGQAIYNFRNAKGENRYSAFDIVDSDEEDDPLNRRYGARHEDAADSSAPSDGSPAAGYCPYCGAPPRRASPSAAAAAKSCRNNVPSLWEEGDRRLWYDFLRSYPVRFYRQKVLGSYIVDFYCARARLVIELDGSQHAQPEAALRDAERTAFLQSYGLQVLRIPNPDVRRHFSAVCALIDLTVQQALRQQEK